MRIVLLSCASKKLDAPAPARDMYVSPLFRKSLRYAENLNPDKIYVLSALHKVLELDTVIEPYDVTLSKISREDRIRKPNLVVLTPEERNQWGIEVLNQLSQVADLKNDAFTILAGNEYIIPIMGGLVNVEQPLRGLRQGERLKFLSNID